MDDYGLRVEVHQEPGHVQDYRYRRKRMTQPG
jgi:hypothetical protein